MAEEKPEIYHFPIRCRQYLGNVLDRRLQPPVRQTSSPAVSGDKFLPTAEVKSETRRSSTGHFQDLEDIAERQSQSLARQNLPKCEPGIFDGDAASFLPLKASFDIMIAEAGVGPTQELNYMSKFTRGRPKELADNHLKRF